MTSPALRARHAAFTTARPIAVYRVRHAALCAFALASVSAHAGLYPPAAPPGSAFIRVFNDSAQPKIPATIGGKTVPDIATLDASGYIFLPPGTQPAKIGPAEQSLELKPSRCYTAALIGTSVKLFDQDCFNSQLKAMVSVYNLIDGTSLSLKTADGATTLVDNVAAQSAGHREVNAIKASLAVFDGATKLADAKPTTLERGKAFSLFVTGSSAQPVLIWVVN